MSDADESRGSLTATVVRGVGFAGSGFILARGITLAAYIALARLVTPEELGQFAAGSILVTFGLLVAQSGMLAALIQRRDRIDEAASTAVVATLAAGLALGLGGWAISPLIGSFFDSDTVGAVAAALAGVLFLASARVVPNALLQRRFSFLRRVVVEPASAIAFGVAAIVATSEGMGVWGLVVGQYASAVTDVVLSWGLVRWRPRLRLASFAMWRELVAYGRHVLAGTLVRRSGDQLIPILIVGRFLGTPDLGQFQYANRLVSTPFAFLVAGVSYVVFPAFARISHDAARLVPAFLRSLRWMALVAMPIGLILIPLGEPLAVLVFGERWQEAGQATVALCLFIPARSIAAVVGELFKGTGRPPERTLVNVVGVAAGIAAMFALLPFGLIGVAAGVSVDAIVSAGFSLHRADRAIGISTGRTLATLAAPTAAALLMVAVLVPLELFVVDAQSHGTALGLLLVAGEGLLGLLIYAAGLRVLAPGVAAELLGLVRTARRGSQRQLEPSDGSSS